MPAVTEKACAKINWALDVLRRRDDRYHEIDTLMQTVTLHDTLTFEEAESLSLDVGGAPLPNDNDNLILRAAELLRDRFEIRRGAHIRLEKRIPVAAGLGGGSADAAAAFRGLCALWGLYPGYDALQELALSVGADVPFCLRGGLARARGVGEKLVPLDGLSDGASIVIIKPCRGVSAREVYEAFDELEGSVPRALCVPDATCAIARRDSAAFFASLGNALQPVTSALRPDVQTALDALAREGANAALMSGSGPSVYGVFPTPAKAKAAYASLARHWPQIHLCKTCDTSSENYVFVR